MILFIMEHVHAYIAICTYNYMDLYICYSHAFSFYVVQIMNGYLKLLAYSNKNTYVTNYDLYSQSSCSHSSAISFTISKVGVFVPYSVWLLKQLVAIVIYITVLCMTTTCEIIIYTHRKILAEMIQLQGCTIVHRITGF